MRALKPALWAAAVLSAFLLIHADPAAAQRTVTVEPGFGTLNTAVDGDTTAAGARVDSATVYVLKRGGTYLMSGSIENRYPLTIVAEEGTGERPKLIPGVPTGGESSRPFRARDDITLKGLYITNEDELGKRLLRTIRVSADSVRVVIDDCHLDKSNQSAFRLDNDDNILHLTNTIISDIGNYASPNNGRGVDDRGNDIDSLVVSNCTFYNLTSTVLRDGGGGKINYCDFNHNTIVNTGMQAIEVGESIETHITNNVFINTVYFGLGPQGGSETTEGYHILVYPLNEDLVAAGAQQVINIRNNNFYTDPALAAAWPEWVGTGRPLFNDHALDAVRATNTGSTNIHEALTFTNGPVAPTALVTAWYSGQPGEIPVLTTVDTAVPFDLTGAPFNFAYPSTATSYTASTGGQPLGDLTWHDLTIASGDRNALIPFRTVVVEPGFGTLNAAVDGDTTATGARVDSATVYQLKRGGLYLMSGSIENRYPLTIVAEDGTGERPKLIPGVPTGGESSRPFRARADITLRGLYITNEDELGKRLLRTIRVSADRVRVVVEDCHLDKSNQSAFRLDNEDNIIHLTNTIISDIGNYASPNNGRGIDDRGNDIDSLVVSNCTFYNLTSTVLRDGGGGKINYCDFNHNTIVNTGMQAIEVGESIETHITNNVFINGVFFGLGPQGGSEITEGYHILVYALNEDLVAAGVKQVINIRNNNFYTDPALAAAWPEWVGTGRPLFNDVAAAGIKALNTGTTNIEEALTFTNGPVAPTALVTAWYSGQPGEIPVLTTVDTAVPFDLTGAPFDFAYPSTATSYTASTGGQPLGDLTWHDLTVASGDRTTAVPFRRVTVEAGFGTLNAAVDGDTTAAGARVDPATIYVLKRDATYLMSGSIENRYPLTIVAEDGTGERPKLIPGVPTGGESSRPFRARDDITLKGLYITNEDELGKRLLRTIRVSADSVRVVIDDCHIDKSNQSAFRLDNEDNIIHLTNTIISDIGNYASPNNGRGVDDRGNDIDSLVVSNCTFYNLTSTVLRDGGGGKINYCDFNHNTIVNTGMQAIEVGEAIETHITNNVFVNGVFFGLGPQGGSEITEGYHILVYALNEDLKSAGVKQVVNIRNNNFYTDPALKAAWPEWVGTGRPLFNDVAQLGIATLSTDSTNIEEALTFTNGPVAPTALVTAWYAGQPGGIPVLTTVDTAVPFDLTGAPFNFAYPSTAQSYTASTGEQPLGDLTWHGLTIAASDRTTDFTPAVDAATADFNTDGKVDFSDFVLFAQAFGKAQDDTGYDAKFDLDGDNKIAFGDFVRFAQSFGKTLSKPAGLSKPVGDLPPGVNSNTGFSLVTRPTGKADEVEVAVRLSAAVRVEGYKLRVQYNDSAIELLKASAAEGASVLFDDLAERDVERAAGEPLPVVLQISTQPGKIILADMVRPEAAIQGEGVLIRLSFRLLDKTVAGQVVIDEVQVSDGLGRINDLTGARLEELRALPTEYALSRNYPNPFNPDTQIPYQLPEAGDVSLVVYNMLGQQVSALVSDEQQPGYYRVVWDGKDSRGRQVSSGVYLVRMAAGEFSDVKKVLLLK